MVSITLVIILISDNNFICFFFLFVDGIPIEFVTLEDDSEGLIIRTYCNNETFTNF